MIVVDSSAIIAILRAEDDAPRIAQQLAAHKGSCQLSVASYVEIGALIDSARDPIASRAVDTLLKQAAITIAPVSAEQARLAREAYADFGKGSGHPAALNFGDCFSYALAKSLGAPLLFKGDDFSHTDVLVAQ